MQRYSINVQGQVQGVGFRPHVYRIANELSFTGWVKNNASGVQIEIQGKAIDTFIHRLQNELPPLAEIDSIHYNDLSLNANEKKFIIKKSEGGNVNTKISPDATICEDCLTELFDANSRYYHYPFINCTHCGPRYTITNHLPYDRKTTSMIDFVMCDHCQSYYDNPLDRRYHAQPIACEECGPQLSHTIQDITQLIRVGKIVAVKGIGGYQLICDARNHNALKRLRQRKNRLAKPFALMVLNSQSAQHIVEMSKAAETVITSRQRPIVVLPKKDQSLVEDIAPDINSFGVMLANSPLHYLLFHELLGKPKGKDWLNEENNIVLVVTSANPGGCPLIKDDEQAHKKLAMIADQIISYNRDIVIRVDDSVVSLVDDKPFFIRRARSYVPRAIQLPHEIPSTLALGGYLKNTVCVTRGREAFLSQHIGSLNNRETIHFYHETIKHLLGILDVKPQCVAHDLHPDFYSTQVANDFSVEKFPIQHHHAHLAACAAEHSFVGDAIGLALDGFGLGENHEHWGGELIHYQGINYQRIGSLKPLQQPGGDAAALQAWRMAASVLFELGKPDEINRRFGKLHQAKAITELLEKQINSPLTSSCGRLFDAASALLGVCSISQYEGHAAMALESKVTNTQVLPAGWMIKNNQLNMLPLFEQLLHCDAIDGANLFHGTLACALVAWAKQAVQQLRINHIVLAGGCFLNRILSECVIKELTALQLTPLYPRLCPANDGGISLGQAWIAGNKMMESKRCV